MSVVLEILTALLQCGDRLDQVDLRFGRLLRFSGTRTLVALDRLAKISAQFDS